MNADAIAKLLAALIPLGIKLAETIHPLSDSGHQKLATATTFVTMGLGLATASGAIPASAANALDLAAKINSAVAQANAAGGVPKL